MGQGYSLTTLSAGSAGIDVPELSDLAYERSLGEARFMKAIRARHRDGLVLAKVVMKPYASMKFNKYIKEIMRERKILKDIPNALGYHRAFETSSNGYLVRQYIYNSIYDRMSTRPFLEDIEKRWLSFQLLSAIRDCHAVGLYHGDIKTENALVTSWNWLLLCDFSASFKPVFLPEDNPADFSFYFDISGRRTCYLAPERFLASGEKAAGRGGVTWAMDVFSVGCVIAEIFLETPIFNLSQLLKYKQNEYNPVHTQLIRIEDPDIRELIEHMINLEPESRYSADEYLNFWRRKAFPEYFYSFLHQYMHLITDPTSGRSALSSGTTNLGESDDRIDRVYYDFDKISFFLDYEDVNGEKATDLTSTPLNNLFPLHIDIPNKPKAVLAKVAPPTDDGTLLFVNIVTSALRSTARSTGRVRACELLLAFAERMTDEAKLDRVLPYVMFLLNDKVDIVKVAALRTLTQLLALVSTASPVNAYLFPEYILPRLEAISAVSGSKSPPLVRATYASCLAALAQTAARFLDVVQALKAEGTIPPVDPEGEDGMFMHAYQNLYDVARADLVRFFETQTKAMLTDTNVDVRRAFLGSVSSLCVFFGSSKTNDVILSHLNTYLNDRDWKLKCAFFETIVGVATYVGGTNLEEFILPLMIQALTDPEEAVVEKVLRSLATMAELGLFQRSKTWELIDLVARFTMHPNLWIREAAAQFLSSSTRYVSVADQQCIVRPLLDPYLRVPPKTLSETGLLDSLKKPLSRSVLDTAVTWITNVEKGTFWRSVQQRMSSNLIEDRVPITPSKDLVRNALAKMPKNEEDQQWTARLRTAGMGPEDEFKFVALREYIWRTTKRKLKDEVEPSVTRLKDIIRLEDINVVPETVLFDHPEALQEEAPKVVPENPERQPQSIADALLDASTTIEAPASSRESSVSSERTPRRADLANRSLAVPIKNAAARVASPLSSSPATPDDLQVGSSNRKGRKTSNLQAEISGDSTPSDTQSAMSPEDQPGLLRLKETLPRKSSAMELMQHASSSTKANAATSTSSANAMGRVDGLYSKEKLPLVQAREQKRLNPSKIQSSGTHSYSGHDPSILKLLDSLYLRNYPVDVAQYGPTVVPIHDKRWDKRAKSEANHQWRPSGTLIAVLGEHTRAVNRIVPAPDHAFFITGSSDGSIRVWDTSRLERNVAHRSRLVHKHDSGAQVTSMCFIADTYCFASAATDGTIHIVRVDSSESEGLPKYNRIRFLHQWRLPNADKSHAVWIEQYKTDSQSILLIATNASELIALDLRTMATLYTLDIPLHHGTPTCFCINNDKHWLLLGTSHGVLNLFDLRFRLRVLTWAFPAATPIHRICLHPNNQSEAYSHQVCIAGGTGGAEVTIFDLEEQSCKHVYRSSTPSTSSASSPVKSNTSRPRAALGANHAQTSMKPYTPWYPDTSNTSTAMLTRFATSIAVNDDAPADAQSPIQTSLATPPGHMPSASSRDPATGATLAVPDASPRAIVAGLRHYNSSSSTSQTPSPPASNTSANGTVPSDDPAGDTGPFLLAAGGNVPDDDRLVRFWDLADVRKSCIVGGPDSAADGATGGPSSPPRHAQDPYAPGQTATSYTTTRTTGDAARACEIHQEKRWATRAASLAGSSSHDGGGGVGAAAGAAKSRGNTVVSLQQRQLLRSHLDAVLDVAVVEFPMRMVVSADRSGVIFVFA